MFYKKQKNVTKSYLTKTIQFQNGVRGEKNMESRNNLYFFINMHCKNIIRDFWKPYFILDLLACEFLTINDKLY